MGLDIVEIIFRLEKTFGIHIDDGDLEHYAKPRTPPDLRVSDLHALVHAKWPRYVIIDDAITTDVKCAVCGYNLYGLSPFTRCPECGESAGYEAQIVAGVRCVLIEVLGIDAKRVHDDASVFNDLGAS